MPHTCWCLRMGCECVIFCLFQNALLRANSDHLSLARKAIGTMQHYIKMKLLGAKQTPKRKAEVCDHPQCLKPKRKCVPP